MKRKDVVEMVKAQLAAKRKVPILQLAHEIIKDNLVIKFELDQEFKIGQYQIIGNFSTLQEGSLALVVKKMEGVRGIINKFHNDEISIEDFNTMLAAFIKLPTEDKPLIEDKPIIKEMTNE